MARTKASPFLSVGREALFVFVTHRLLLSLLVLVATNSLLRYGLRGVGGQTIMEFAISGVTQDENGTLAQILRVLNESDVVGMVRQVSEKHQSFDAS